MANARDQHGHPLSSITITHKGKGSSSDELQRNVSLRLSNIEIPNSVHLISSEKETDNIMKNKQQAV